MHPAARDDVELEQSDDASVRAGRAAPRSLFVARREGTRMAISEIAFTMYPVTDMQRALSFYRDALGLEPSGEESPYWVEFDVAGGTFGIGTFEQVGKAGTAQSLSLEVEDLTGFRAALASKGVDVSEPHELTNCAIAMVSDPDGNGIWLHERKRS